MTVNFDNLNTNLYYMAKACKAFRDNDLHNDSEHIICFDVYHYADMVLKDLGIDFRGVDFSK